jgi:hypothetical protein
LKNEVKKKMHVVRRAMLYQSHRKKRVREENFKFDLFTTQTHQAQESSVAAEGIGESIHCFSAAH